MKYRFLVMTVAVALAAVACRGGDSAGSGSPTASTTSAATPIVTAYYSTPTGSIGVADVCDGNPAPAVPTDLVVDSPAPSEEVTSPVSVKGQIKAPDSTVHVAIKDSGGNDIAAQQTGHSADSQSLSLFDVQVPFTVDSATLACIWVFQASAEDGSPTKIHEIPVILKP
jgi:hypothetical protein